MNITIRSKGICFESACNRYADFEIQHRMGTSDQFCDDHMCDAVDEIYRSLQDYDICDIGIENIIRIVPLHHSDQVNLEFSPF